MAILRGFPASNTISPSVRITEKDLSFVASNQSFHRAGLVGFASKGPINLPTVISSQRQLNTIFGFPHPDISDPYLIYAASQYLLVASELWVVRVAETDEVSADCATTASVAVPAAGGIVDIVSSVAGDYTFDVDTFFKYELNGVVGQTLTILSTAHNITVAGVVTAVGPTYSALELATDLNDQLGNTYDSNGDLVESLAGVEFYVATDDYIGFRTVWAYGPDASLELISIQNSAYGPLLDLTTSTEHPIGFGTAMTARSTTGRQTSYGTYSATGEWELSGLSVANLQVVIDGTDNIIIDNVVQTITFSTSFKSATRTTAEVAAYINDEITAFVPATSTTAQIGIPGGFKASADIAGNLILTPLAVGVDSRILVKADSTTNTIFGFDNAGSNSGWYNYTYSGTSPEGSVDDGTSAVATYGKVLGSSTSSGTTFTIYAESAGLEGNNTEVVVSNNLRDGTFNLNVFNDGQQVEAWGGLTKDSTSRYYLESYIAVVSDYIRIIDEATHAAPDDNGGSSYVLVGGSDGIPSDPDAQDTLLCGSPLSYTGLYALSEPEQIDIDILAVPGHSSTQVIECLRSVCQDYRMDCIGIVDPPFGLTVSEIIDWQNGQLPSLNTTRFDSDFLALYWPWVKLRDTHNLVDVWVPPSGSIMAVYARSDFLSAPWFAPAGATRGIVPGITDVFSRPTLEERDLMYGNSNCINPIVQFSDLQNFTVWGQKTMQRSPTALDRVNVRRLMFAIEKRIAAKSKTMLFEPNDGIFQSKFITMAASILDEIRAGRGIYAYFIEAGADLNTADVIDRNEFRARIGIQPTKSVEFMFLEFSIHRTGSFEAIQ